MNVHSTAQMDKAAFLAWAQGREGRYELVENRVVMMVGVSNAHSIVTGNLFVTLRQQVDSSQWTVHADYGVDVGPRSVRYPDVMVAKFSKAYQEFTAKEPVLIAEVLSPSTATLDLGDKTAEYLRLSTLAAYVVFAQDEPKAWSWVRIGGAFPAGSTVITGRDAVLDVPALGLSISLRDVYQGIEDRPQS